MLRAYDLEISRETVRRWLHLGGLVYRRPRPVLKPDREERRARLAELRRLLAELPDDETAVFQDEVDVLQPIMPLDLPVKVRPWELTVYPRSHIRR